MTRSNRISLALTEAFSPVQLKVIDESALHAGHAGASPEGETHYKVEITTPAFRGLSRIAMQRAVMDALKGEFDTGLHALSIKAGVPPG